MEKILTVNDVAGILQVKAITVREMFREKRLRGFKVGKAWRTTPQMLQEDIETLARGVGAAPAPATAAPPETGEKVEGNGASHKKPRKKRPSGSGKAETEKASPKPRRSAPADVSEAAVADGPETAQDSQQLLF